VASDANKPLKKRPLCQRTQDRADTAIRSDLGAGAGLQREKIRWRLAKKQHLPGHDFRTICGRRSRPAKLFNSPSAGKQPSRATLLG
jgi:hypothetical protein